MTSFGVCVLQHNSTKESYGSLYSVVQVHTTINRTYCQGEHFRINDDSLSDFSRWFEAVQHDYCLLSEDEAETVNVYIKTGELFDHLNNLLCYGFSYTTGKYGSVKEKDYAAVQKKFDVLEEEVNGMIYNRLISEYEAAWDENNQANYLTTCFIDNFIDDPEHTFMTKDYHLQEYIPGHYISAHMNTIY